MVRHIASSRFADNDGSPCSRGGAGDGTRLIFPIHPHSQAQRTGGGDLEGGADGAGGFLGVGPDGVGGVLDGGAAGVEDVDELVAAEAGEAFFLRAFLLPVLGFLVFVEEGLDGGDFLRGGEAGEIVRRGAGDEAGGALDEEGAALADAGADEVSVEREVRGRVSVLGEHLELLLGGALDFPEAGEEGFGGGLGLRGVRPGLVLGEAGVGGAQACFGEGRIEEAQVFRADALLRHGGPVAEGGGEDGIGFIDVLELFLVEISARARGVIRGGIGLWRGFFGHGSSALAKLPAG